VLEGYTDYADLAAKGLIYWYNPDIAVQVLKNAGFQDFDGDTRRDDWQDPGPDLTWGTGDDGSIEYDSYGDLIFYIRMDDLNLMQAGLLLASGMQAVSIPVKEIITEESVCRRQVKVLYDYHLYTELRYYEDTWVPTWLYTEWNSQFYWAPQPFSPNYPGFCNREYDYWSEKFYTATTPDELLESALKCQEIMANYTGSIPVWCPPPDAVKAYKTKYDGVVNDFAVGVDNYYSFLLMNDTGPSDGVIHWGFCPDIEGVHVICAEWLWDWKTIGLIYESMISRQPYDKTIGSYDYWLATDYTVGTWGTEGYTEVNFTIRTGVVWQDGVAFAPADVVFSLEFTRHCGRGVAWNFAGVQYLNTTWAEGNRIIVRLNTAKPLTGVEDLGFLPIVPKHIWEAKYPNWEDWYNETTGRWSDDRFVVRNWKPWEEPHPIYNATNPHPINGVLTKAIGTGAWIFDTHVANQYIALHANRLYYKTQAQVEADIKEMFWKLGDANGNMVVDGMDVLMLQACWPPNPYDPRCDFNKDGVIDVLDAFLIFKNFGRRGDC
jgi:ABC-type transport system substrate-binding protein